VRDFCFGRPLFVMLVKFMEALARWQVNTMNNNAVNDINFHYEIKLRRFNYVFCNIMIMQHYSSYIFILLCFYVMYILHTY
jgi:hypothetical protein